MYSRPHSQASKCACHNTFSSALEILSEAVSRCDLSFVSLIGLSRCTVGTLYGYVHDLCSQLLSRCPLLLHHKSESLVPAIASEYLLSTHDTDNLVTHTMWQDNQSSRCMASFAHWFSHSLKDTKF